jgi:hypothetical protein
MGTESIQRVIIPKLGLENGHGPVGNDAGKENEALASSGLSS